MKKFIIIGIFSIVLITGCQNVEKRTFINTPTATGEISPKITETITPTKIVSTVRPTIEPTLKPRSIPTATLSPKDQDFAARKAYDKMLSAKYYKMDNGSLASMKEVEFWVVDINGDGISELFLYNPFQARKWLYGMYYYHDGKVVDSEAYGSGLISYYKGTGVFISSGFAMGTGWEIYYRFDGKKVKWLGTVKNTEDKNGKEHATYTIRDKKISHKKFLLAVKKWTNETKVFDLWDLIKNNKKNREKYILVE